MVLHKKLDYGFNGYQVPSFPRASRSARGKSWSKSKAEEKQMFAFELLATVAGSLSRIGEDSQSQTNVVDERVQALIVDDIVKQKQQDGKKPFGPCDLGSCDESVFVSDFCSQGQLQNKNGKELPAPKHATVLEDSSLIADSSCFEKLEHSEAVTGQKTKELGKSLFKTDGGSSGYGEPRGNVVDGIVGQLDFEMETGEKNITLPNTCSSESPMEFDVKPPTFVNMDNAIEVTHTSSFPFQSDMKLVCKDDDEKDDDENFSRCTHPHTGNLKAFRPPPRIGGRRIRRLLASKYWKVPPKLNGRELFNSGTRHVFRNTKACYSLQGPRRTSNFRRKLFKHRLTSRAEEVTRSDHLFKSSKDNKAPTGSASRASSQESLSPRDSRVRLSIKSFRVPELFIEIPESATVGSLKRTVREAVSAILAGGLCVGVVLQGKKVKDDNKTLHQTGISHDDKLDALGFMLEPNPSPVSTPMSPPQSSHQEDSPVLVTCDIPQPLDRYPKIPVGDPLPSDATSSPRLTNAVTLIENGVDAVPSPVAIIAEKSALDSRTLISSPKSVEPLAALPLHRKSRKSEFSQRRIRRPFSVSEVEALVQAVEKLGTGRWRDVKHWAFDGANHRTYVDLKDKWKTLVHTARIAPQQRRGEPVPQELLDRVLAAHAHWSQQQAKQHIKQQTEPCFHPF